jgi:hypothetical protein
MAIVVRSKSDLANDKALLAANSPVPPQGTIASAVL